MVRFNRKFHHVHNGLYAEGQSLQHPEAFWIDKGWGIPGDDIAEDLCKRLNDYRDLLDKAREVTATYTQNYAPALLDEKMRELRQMCVDLLEGGKQ